MRLNGGGLIHLKAEMVTHHMMNGAFDDELGEGDRVADEQQQFHFCQ